MVINGGGKLMPNYNIFKVDPEQKEKMLLKFEAEKLKITFDDYIDNYRYRFFFSNQPISAQISWLELYKMFINLKKEPQNKSYYAVLLITMPNGNEYAVSLGKSHFFLQSPCIYDFGLQLAERIFEKAKLKHGKHFSSRRNKTITSYYQNNNLYYESGEAIGMVKGSTIDASTWGRSVSFGQSVKLSIDLQPEELYTLLEKIEQALELEPRIKLPRAHAITDRTKIRELDALICQRLLDNEVSIDVDEFSCNSVYFSFADEYECFYIKISTLLNESRYSRKSERTDDLSSEQISRFLHTISADGVQLLEHLDDIKVALCTAENKPISRPLKEMLEVVTDDWCCLINGKWMQFSQEYIAYLKDQVDSIRVNIDEPIVIRKYSATQIKTLFTQNEVEATLIEQVAHQKGYTILHKKISAEARALGFNLEIADMQSEDCLYFIKMGKTQKLVYVINQSLTTIAFLRNQRMEADPYVKDINYICLWLIFDERQTNLEQLSDINSIILLIALNDWIATVKDAGYIPAVNISYRREQ